MRMMCSQILRVKGTYKKPMGINKNILKKYIKNHLKYNKNLFK